MCFLLCWILYLHFKRKKWYSGALYCICNRVCACFRSDYCLVRFPVDDTHFENITIKYISVPICCLQEESLNNILFTAVLGCALFLWRYFFWPRFLPQSLAWIVFAFERKCVCFQTTYFLLNCASGMKKVRVCVLIRTQIILLSRCWYDLIM